MSLLLCTNMNGSEKLNPVLIGKEAHPTALKKHGVMFKDLGIEYFWNQKGWMTGPVFDLWLTDWNNNLIKQNHHVLLLIDQCSRPCHWQVLQHQNPVPTTQYYSKVTAPRSRYHQVNQAQLQNNPDNQISGLC